MIENGSKLGFFRTFDEGGSVPCRMAQNSDHTGRSGRDGDFPIIESAEEPISVIGPTRSLLITGRRIRGRKRGCAGGKLTRDYAIVSLADRLTLRGRPSGRTVFSKRSSVRVWFTQSSPPCGCPGSMLTHTRRYHMQPRPIRPPRLARTKDAGSGTEAAVPVTEMFR